MRSRIAALAITASLASMLVAPRAIATPERAYAFTRGSHFLSGGSELVVPTLTLPQGTELVLVNLHIWGHSITSDAWKERDVRLFRSDVIPFGKQTLVRGVERLPTGSYGFFCANHMGMRGTLIVI